MLPQDVEVYSIGCLCCSCKGYTQFTESVYREDAVCLPHEAYRFTVAQILLHSNAEAFAAAWKATRQVKRNES